MIRKRYPVLSGHAVAIKRGWILALWLLLIAGLASSPRADRVPLQPGTLPFSPGERLSYLLRWSVVPAGEATLEVLPMKMVDGEQAFHFRLTVTTNSFVDLFYKVRDRVDGYVDQTVSRSLRYQQKQAEGDTRRNVSVAFDWSAGKVLHQEEGKTTSSTLPEGAFDPLSVLYYIRTLAFEENDLVERVISDGKKSIVGRARVVGKERIEVAGGSFDTYLLEPEMEHIGGVFEKDKGAKIRLWVTADHRRIPVKIASKVSVGSFVGELAAIE